MPHLTVEYSANLDGRTDLGHLCEALLETLLQTGLFEIGAIRVRALRADHFAIADRLAENGFIDLVLRIGTGRTDEEKKRTGEALFACATDVLGPLFETPHFALSLEIREIDPALSWKKNAIHPRLRGK
ncbi:5-carboxymethyl-2-hydroxymuconate Delta-isomerase [Rhizobium sp. FY34]|uniref:5-carboxymethyl-2-hydroxymuconate Delta-isomerase n=1 Tax=Rhizobium sp. FY34 TaxID=2562309 RepID=UPI0010BFA30A|nr:5-carboxymethyl-2-hydroxymuconate Delta-isomerase [Rhizobium sp. FY34]